MRPQQGSDDRRVGRTQDVAEAEQVCLPAPEGGDEFRDLAAYSRTLCFTLGADWMQALQSVEAGSLGPLVVMKENLDRATTLLRNAGAARGIQDPTVAVRVIDEGWIELRVSE